MLVVYGHQSILAASLIISHVLPTKARPLPPHHLLQPVRMLRTALEVCSSSLQLLYLTR